MAASWHIAGDYVLACNCDYGCPCNFNARPSAGFCQGAIGFTVTEGAYGDVRLDGQKAFVGVNWPGAIHEGNGVAAIFIHEGASPAQRDALATILTGAAGGAPWGVFATTWARVLGPYFTRIDLKAAGKETEVTVGDRIRIAFQPIRNPVTKAEAFPRVVLPQGFVFLEGEQYSLKEFWVAASPELTFAHPGKCAALAKVRWKGP
ncbi:MAG: DUF1326 domain-containing protein [Armatimonadetes bacterium]|nr:DUF1326 domain-containing protein [Armatimonadota bacterium]